MIAEALQSLRPGARFRVDSEGVIYWQDQEQSQPSDSEIQTEATRLQADYDLMEYSRNRKESYPPMENYLDGIVKGDQAQIDKYISDCLAVKQRFPK